MAAVASVWSHVYETKQTDEKKQEKTSIKNGKTQMKDNEREVKIKKNKHIGLKTNKRDWSKQYIIFNCKGKIQRKMPLEKNMALISLVYFSGLCLAAWVI